MPKPDRDDLTLMLAAYIKAALWSTMDESGLGGGEPLEENYTFDDIDSETLAKMRGDVHAFAKKYAKEIDGDWEWAGHDLWLTRNGHGAGFWDGDWPEPAASILDKAAKQLGEVNLYAEAGKIYV